MPFLRQSAVRHIHKEAYVKLFTNFIRTQFNQYVNLRPVHLWDGISSPLAQKGKKDKAFRKRELERWKRIFPDARVRVLEDAGHFIQEDAPGAIAEEIRAFMGAQAA